MSRALLDSLELPHWLILAGTLLVIASVSGLVNNRKRFQKVDAPDETSEARAPNCHRYRKFATPGGEENGVRLMRPIKTRRRRGRANERAGDHVGAEVDRSRCD